MEVDRELVDMELELAKLVKERNEIGDRQISMEYEFEKLSHFMDHCTKMVPVFNEFMELWHLIYTPCSFGGNCIKPNCKECIRQLAVVDKLSKRRRIVTKSGKIKYTKE